MQRFLRALAVVTIIAIGSAAGAQTEDALRAAFEGKRVAVRIDMPGTSDGVDIHGDARQTLDYKEYGDRLKRYGVAIRAGDSVTVTLLKMKKDLIEVQLAGGGFGTFGDDTSTSVSIPDARKSERERDLERRIDEPAYRRRARAPVGDKASSNRRTASTERVAIQPALRRSRAREDPAAGRRRSARRVRGLRRWRRHGASGANRRYHSAAKRDDASRGGARLRPAHRNLEEH